MLKKVYAVDKTLTDPLQGNITSLADFFGLIINVIIGIGISLTIVYLVLGGIQYITAKGDAKAAEEARGALTNAVIGFVVVLAAITLKVIFENVLGADTSGFSDIVPTTV